MQTVIYGASVMLLAFGATLGLHSWMNGMNETALPIAVATENTAVPLDMNMGAQIAHSHPQKEVSADLPVPTVTHLVFPDVMDGYNVQILTENFKFTPSAINKDIVPNEGHAHLYINGEKVSRVYGNWVHVPASLLVPGANAVTVTLNANDHSEWAENGISIESSVIVVKKDLRGEGTQ